MWEHIAVYTPVTWVLDVGLSEAFVTKGFFASLLLNDILLTSILISHFSFHFFFSDIPVVVLVCLDFEFFIDHLFSSQLQFILRFLFVIF